MQARVILQSEPLPQPSCPHSPCSNPLPIDLKCLESFLCGTPLGIRQGYPGPIKNRNSKTYILLVLLLWVAPVLSCLLPQLYLLQVCEQKDSPPLSLSCGLRDPYWSGSNITHVRTGKRKRMRTTAEILPITVSFVLLSKDTILHWQQVCDREEVVLGSFSSLILSAEVGDHALQVLDHVAFVSELVVIAEVIHLHMRGERVSYLVVVHADPVFVGPNEVPILLVCFLPVRPLATHFMDGVGQQRFEPKFCFLLRALPAHCCPLTLAICEGFCLPSQSECGQVHPWIVAAVPTLKSQSQRSDLPTSLLSSTAACASSTSPSMEAIRVLYPKPDVSSAREGSPKIPLQRSKQSFNFNSVPQASLMVGPFLSNISVSYGLSWAGREQ
eukprot:3824077-Rhodomonas_salina.1